MRKFRNRVGLIHELRKLRRTEEFFYRGTDGAHVDKTLRSDFLGILSRHSFLDNAFQSCDTDTELVLQKFADRTHATVAEVVYVVNGIEPEVEVEVDGYRGDYIVHGYVLMIEFVEKRTDVFLPFHGKRFFEVGSEKFVEFHARLNEFNAGFLRLFVVLFVLGFFFARGDYLILYIEELVDLFSEIFRGSLFPVLFRHVANDLGEFERGIINVVQKPEESGVYARSLFETHHVVTYYFMFCAVHVRVYHVYAGVLNRFRNGLGYNLPRGGEHFAVRADDIFVSLYPDKPYADTQTLVEFIPADLCKVVSSRVEEKVFKVLFNRVVGRNFARAQSAVQFYKTFAFGFGRIFCGGVFYHLVAGEKFAESVVAAEAQSP